jgi:hypothetical protein
MSWNQISTFNNTNLLSWAVEDSGGWIIRGYKDLFAVDVDTFDIKWRVQIGGDPSFAYKGVVATSDRVILSVQYSDVSNVQLQAFERGTGQQVWNRKLGWQLRKNFGGLLIYNDLLAFMEQDPEGVPHFVILDATTGISIQELPGFKSISVGPRPSSARSAIVSGGYAYFIAQRDGLHRCEISKASDIAFERVLEVTPKCIHADHSFVYCVLRGEVVQLHSVSGKELGRIEFPENVKVEKAIALPVFDEADFGQIALLLEERQGMILVDFEDGKWWRVGEREGWYLTHIASTPYGLAVVLYEAGEPLFILDRSTGAVKEKLSPGKNRRWESFVYWMNNSLLVDHSSGARVLEYVDDGKTGLLAPEPVPVAASSVDTVDETVTGTTQSEMREVDCVFSDIVQTFVNCMSADQGTEEHVKLAHQFNAKLDVFFKDHPGASLANVADGLAKLGIPYEQALTDVAQVRTLGRGDE